MTYVIIVAEHSGAGSVSSSGEFENRFISGDFLLIHDWIILVSS